jgi:N-acyl-D-amino-acid deacylase
MSSRHVDAVCDLVIRDGVIVDGTGGASFRGDVAVRGDRIAEIGSIPEGRGWREVAADRRVISPGFVDMHIHADLAAIRDRRLDSAIGQGVTLQVVGHDGLAYAPVTPETAPAMHRLLTPWNGELGGLDLDDLSVAGYLERASGASTNIALLAPHGTIRAAVIGFERREPTQRELAKMKEILAQALAEGAVGMSTGLQYVPALFARTHELSELCSVVAEHGGFFAPHIRSYGADALDAYDECFAIQRASGVALHLTHAHLSYAINAGRADELLARVHAARADGLDVTLDSYPYLTGIPKLAMLLPEWAAEGGHDATIARLRDPAERRRINASMLDDPFEGVPISWDTLELQGLPPDRPEELRGRTFADAARRSGCEPFDLFCDLLIEGDLALSCIEHIGNENNVRTVMQDAGHMLSSDAILSGARPHPRGWGTFARFFETYVRELGLFPLEEAIRKITSAPAARLRLPDRGVLRVGAAADITCFDPQAVRDRSSFEDPRARPEGFDLVVVNGAVAFASGEFTNALSGLGLRSIR